MILIWATTPLGIKWSGEGVGFLFGVTGRTAIGLIACLLLVALIALVTPVLALLLGHLLNHEVVGVHVWLGTMMILAGLASYQWGDRWRAAWAGAA